MFKFYFELSFTQKNVLASCCWGGDIRGDASCDVRHVTFWKFAGGWIKYWKREVLSKGIYLKSRCCWELFIDDAIILRISNSCLWFFSASLFLISKNYWCLSFWNSIFSWSLLAFYLVIPLASWIKACVCDCTAFRFKWAFNMMAFFLLADILSSWKSS